MVFKMTITNIRHDEFGKQEDRIVLENAQPLSDGQELLQLLNAAGQKSFNSKKPLPKSVPAVPPENEITVQVDSQKLARDAMDSLSYALQNKKLEAQKKEAPSNSRPKAVDLIGAKTRGFTIAEKIGALPEADFSAEDQGKGAGFIEPNKLDEVQVLIRCHECGYNGTHTTRYGNSYTPCRSCSKKLRLERAADYWGEPDFDGNIYQAQDRYKTAKERWEEKNQKQGEAE